MKLFREKIEQKPGKTKFTGLRVFFMTSSFSHERLFPDEHSYQDHTVLIGKIATPSKIFGLENRMKERPD